MAVWQNYLMCANLLPSFLAVHQATTLWTKLTVVCF